MFLSIPCICTNLLILCSGKAKPNKKAKKDKLTDEHVFKGPELETAAPKGSTHEPLPEPAYDTPMPIVDPPAEWAADGSENPETPSPARIDDPQGPDVEITQTGYVEPGRPTVLAKCSAKEELLERRRVKLDVANYTHMSIGEVFSGYLSQVHSSRGVEINMVKQMHQKFEVQSFLCIDLSLLCQPPSLLLMMNML